VGESKMQFEMSESEVKYILHLLGERRFAKIAVALSDGLKKQLDENLRAKFDAEEKERIKLHLERQIAEFNKAGLLNKIRDSEMGF
jgi:hypothetical protein